MNFGIALLALAIEAGAGYPDALFRRIGHPVTWMGALIAALDRGLNREADSFALRRSKGALALAALLVIAVGSGALIERAALALPFGWIALAVVASSLLAQRSLHAHVAAVAEALAISVDDGRTAVAKIVGRDVSALDESGVARAAIESLAENFSDGVVAPALWLAVFGLPGALAYKAVNTADSMIGHKSARYLAFGWAAARCDDLMNCSSRARGCGPADDRRLGRERRLSGQGAGGGLARCAKSRLSQRRLARGRDCWRSWPDARRTTLLRRG